MLSCGRWIFSSPVSTVLSGTGSPLMVTVAVSPASSASAAARNWASLEPGPPQSPAKVLHSNVCAGIKILVPALTVHVNDPPPNGATILPLSTKHWAWPSPNGLSGVGVSRTVGQKSPRVFPRLVGAALADGATKQNMTAARSSVRARRDTANLLGCSFARHSHTGSRAASQAENTTLSGPGSVPLHAGRDDVTGRAAAFASYGGGSVKGAGVIAVVGGRGGERVGLACRGGAGCGV